MKDDWEEKFKSLVQELNNLLKARGYWTGNPNDNDGARLIQAIGLALEKAEKREEK